MQCFEAFFGVKPSTKPLESFSMGTIDFFDPDNGASFTYIVPDSQKAKVDAASKLEANFAKVVRDITNPGPLNIDGKTLSQPELQRVDPKHVRSVEAMVKAVCSRLRGSAIPAPSKEDAMVWTQAAKFLGARVQGSKPEMPGREPDMSLAAATAMKKVLGQIEVACKMIWNRETIVMDITNSGARGVKGGELSQTDLKRLDPKNKAAVDAMVREMSDRLLGGGSQMTSVAALTEPGAKQRVLVWADAASFFAGRIQGPADECEFPHENRKADMSNAAATALRTTLARMEAAHRLASNYEMVVQDIVNPGPNGLKGKPLTQLNLTRVESRHKASMQEMVMAVCSRLLGQEVSGPSTPEEALVWVQGATFLSGRIQKTDYEMPGRAADMSVDAALAMQKVLAQIEAASKLMSNRDKVVKDICNQGSTAINGGQVTQTELKRLQPGQQSSVDAMVREVCGCLLGKTPGPSDAQVWPAAANYLHLRIQDTAKGMPGRNRDMSVAAATAMRTVLASF